VAGGDVERFDIGAGAQHHADLFALIHQRNERSFFQRHFTVRSGEARFGYADGGDNDQKAEVGGDAEATGVGNALPVAQR